MSVRMRRKTSWFVTLPIAATAIGFLSLIYFPTARSIRETRNEIRLKEDLIQEIPSLHVAAAKLQQELQEIEAYQRAVRSAHAVDGTAGQCVWANQRLRS